MSKQDLLTKTEVLEAAAQGWSLCHIYDLATKKWRVQVYGAIKALRLVQESHTQGTT